MSNSLNNINSRTNVLRLLLFWLLCFTFLEAAAQDKLPKELTAALVEKIKILKSTDKYFNAEILELFSKDGKDYWETQNEIENLAYNFDNQKLLFDHWYNKYNENILIDGKIWGCYEHLFRYFKNFLQLSNAASAYIANYISKQKYNTNENSSNNNSIGGNTIKNKVILFLVSDFKKNGKKVDYKDTVRIINDTLMIFNDGGGVHRYVISKTSSIDVKTKSEKSLDSILLYTASYTYDITEKKKDIGFIRFTNECNTNDCTDWLCYVIIKNNMFLFRSKVIN